MEMDDMPEYEYMMPESPVLVIVTEEPESTADDSTVSDDTTSVNNTQTQELPNINWFHNTSTSTSANVTGKWYLPPAPLCESTETKSPLDMYVNSPQVSTVPTNPCEPYVPTNDQLLNAQPTPYRYITTTNEPNSSLEFSSVDKTCATNNQILSAQPTPYRYKMDAPVTNGLNSSLDFSSVENKHVDKQSCVNSSDMLHDNGSFFIDKILGLDKFPDFSSKSVGTPDHVTSAVDNLSVNLSVNEGSDVKDVVRRLCNKKYLRRSEKPPYTYVAMIAATIMQSKKGHLSLPAIRDQLKTYFPFFNGEYQGWKNSVRHALSNSKIFYKVDFSDEMDMSVTHVWKVMYSNLKPNTFKRNDTANNAASYKSTVQEQLGLPPFDLSDLRLPPKPTVVDNLNINMHTTHDEDDVLNARNECISTPASVISEQDVKVQSSGTTNYKPLNSGVDSIIHPTGTTSHKPSTVNSRKRKRCDDEMSKFNSPAVATETQQMYDYYQNYYNHPQFMIGQQWSPDYGYYGYQENLPMMQQEVYPYSHQPGNQGYGYEQYYRQWLLNQSINWSVGQYGSYLGYQPTNFKREAAVDLSNVNVERKVEK